MKKVRFLQMVCVALLFCAATAIASPAQILTTLYTFCSPPYDNCPDGAYPIAGLIQATDGNFYGTTNQGGAYGYGTVFKITRSGKLTTLYSFCSQYNCPDGANPYGGLIQATDGNFYGTTYYGGRDQCDNGCGTVFKITASGTLTTLHTFAYPDGAYPIARLVQAADGNFYGTTNWGGDFSGTVFKMTPSGALSTLYSFGGGDDGAGPWAGLVQGTDGNFYGTTSSGGSCAPWPPGCGTVFKITPSGTLTTLYRFCAQAGCADGWQPYAGLIQATDGNFYGTTSLGGGGSDEGTVFKITPSGTLTTLYGFDCNNGCYPYAGLVQATDGNFYGTTYGLYGTVFKITPSGTLTTLFGFDGFDGGFPYAGLYRPLTATSTERPPAGITTLAPSSVWSLRAHASFARPRSEDEVNMQFLSFDGRCRVSEVS
jgi:uncharacterized repeat protein (TIGR03803 family)